MEIILPDKAQFLFKKKRYKILPGGRDSAKSTSAALYALIIGAESKKRILCTREIQKSIADSIHKLLSDLNDTYELGYIVTDKSIKHPISETEFIFTGLHRNVRSIKSLEGIDLVICEEAESITNDSWQLLIPTIRKEGSELIIVFNPYDESDDTYTKFLAPYISKLNDDGFYEDEHIAIQFMNYYDNPFLSETSKKEIQKLKEEDKEEYDHVYLGEPKGQDQNVLIKRAWFNSAIDAHLQLAFEEGGINTLGFDVSDDGKDESAVVHRTNSVVNYIEQYKESLENSTTSAFNIAKDLNTDVINYDVCGMGIGVTVKSKQLDPRNKYNWTPIDNSEKAKGVYDEKPANKVFYNTRAQNYWNLRERFRKTHLAITQGKYFNPDELISISSECEYIKVLKEEISKINRVPNQRIQIEPKKNMKKSPNIADALAYCFVDSSAVNSTNLESISIDFESEW